MIYALVIASVMAAPAGPDSAAPIPADLAAYKEAKASAGRDADSQIRLALWCEARGMNAERTKHLTIATLVDPQNVTARGLLGMVQYQGKWLSPDAVAQQTQADPEQQAKVREYLERRVKAADKPDDQMKLALWCEQNDLKDQATAHFYRAAQLDPGREQAWRHLGYKREKGRWAKPEQLAAEKEMAELQIKANKHWKPILDKLRHGLASKSQVERDKAQAALNEIKDPAAVPAIWATFAQGDSRRQEVAVRLFGQIDSPDASKGLAMLAVAGRSADVRRHSVEILKVRDPRDFADVLIALIRKPIEYEVRRKAGLNSPGELFVKGTDQNYRRLYTPLSTPEVSLQLNDTIKYDANGLPVISRYLGDYTQVIGTYRMRGTPGLISEQEIRNFLFSSGILQQAPAQTTDALARAGIPADVLRKMSAGSSVPNLNITVSGQRDATNLQISESYVETLNIPVGQMVVDAQRSAEEAQQQLNRDVQQLEAHNGPIRETNRKARQALADSTGVDLGDDPEAWQRWSTDLMGLAVASSQPTPEVPTVTDQASLEYQPQGISYIVDQATGVTIVQSHSCFAAGTMVRTVEGPRPIETLKAGDRVLTQNTSTGKMGFSPVLNPVHNPPNETLRIRFEDQDKPVVATGIHRFWRVGQGWAMARDLVPGDTLRTIGGVARVVSIEPDAKQPVFNLRVAEGESFFVGDLGVLAHDNSLVNPTDRPFDRAEAKELASASRK